MYYGSLYKYQCCGCRACINICPKKCISINTDRVGNFFRIIDKKKCISCGKCDSICPTENISELNYPQLAYVAWNSKNSIVKKSASGGVAATIYRYCLKNSISCIGVHYDNKLRAKYDLIESVEKLDNFVSSKYVYSYMGEIYSDIREHIRNGKKIVFIGLPCHVSAIKNIFKDNDKLICIDLVCHGVVPERFFREHIKKNRNSYVGIASTVNFRETDNQYGISIRGDKGKLLLKKSREEDEYMIGFCNEVTYCEECYSCKYARPERCSDLTLKDFSGNRRDLWRKMPYGLSNILINTEKGKQFFTKIANELNVVEYPVSNVIKEDRQLTKPAMINKKRKFFLKLYPIIGFDWTIRFLFFGKYFKEKIKKFKYE